MLRETFRGSDIVGRLGGDEFAVVAIEASADCERVLRNRLKNNLEQFNRKKPDYNLSLSTGVSHFDSKGTIFVEQLLTQADQALYQEKQSKKTE